MKKFINLISCISIIGLPIITSSCSKNTIQEEPKIDLNNYSLTDGVYEFHSNLVELREPYEKITNDDGSITLIPYIFSSWVLKEDSYPKDQDRMQLLNNVKEYLDFPQLINSDKVYNASLWLDTSQFHFHDYKEKLIDWRIRSSLSYKMFANYDREFYLKKGFPEVVVDKMRDPNYNDSLFVFYNYNDDTNTFETLPETNYYNFLREQDIKKM